MESLQKIYGSNIEHILGANLEKWGYSVDNHLENILDKTDTSISFYSNYGSHTIEIYALKDSYDKLSTISDTFVISQSNFYVGNDTGSSNLALALGVKTFIIHGGTPPYTRTVYRNFYPKLYNSKFLIPILPKGGVLRDPHLKGMDSIPRKIGMDLII